MNTKADALVRFCIHNESRFLTMTMPRSILFKIMNEGSFRHQVPRPDAPIKKEGMVELKSILRDLDAAYRAVVSIEREFSEKAADDIRFQYALKDRLEGAVENLRGHVPDARSTYHKQIGGFEGLDGFNRYAILDDGTIRMSAAHSIQECRERAKELGILVQDFHDQEAYFGPCPCGNGKKFNECHGG